VISIKKYLDMPAEPAGPAALAQADLTQAGSKQSGSKQSGSKQASSKPSASDQAYSGSGPLVAALVQAYRSTIASISNNGARACPAVGSDLQTALTKLQHRLEDSQSSSAVQATEKGVSEQLDAWGGRAAEYFKAKTTEVKELLIALARTAEAMGQRDLRYSGQMLEFTRQLETIANLEDLGQVRESLVRKATELKGCIDQMAEENRRAITALKAEVTTYETRLREAETVAFKDSLTGLFNRRSMEQRIEGAIAEQRPFCVVVLDLNGFKQVNDTHGHAVGDALLVQFAEEVRTNIRSTDVAGRWGGDEFVLLLECDVATARTQIERIEKWVFGEYTLPSAGGKESLKVQVRASVGVAEWKRGDTLTKLIERADHAMYHEKKLARKQHA
jgi:diguanylate cyclase (GGDEF)-like protein